MKVLKKVWLCVVLLMFASASFVAAQSADAENDVETLPLRFASCWQERGNLNAEESSIKQVIENKVDAYQKSELAKEYAEIDSMKEDLIAMGEYENERQYSEQKVAVMAGEMRNRLLEESSVRLDEITQRKNELDREIKELEEKLQATTCRQHSTQVQYKKYDSATQTVKIYVAVPEFDSTYEVTYPFDRTGLSPREVIKRGREEAAKNYTADVYYTVKKGNRGSTYVVHVMSIDVFSENGEKVVSEFAIDKDVKELPALKVFGNESAAVDDGFVFVQGGTFEMGSNEGDSSEKPVHNVTVSSFYICDHEVTQAEYKAVMGGMNPSYFKGDNLPVNNVSWNVTIEYCNRLSISKGLTPCYKFNDGNVICDWSANGYRLPTEAEWEYAAQGGYYYTGYKYSGSDNIDDVAWYDGNSGNQSHDVKTKQPNELGVYDMSGNVWEWCWDWYGNYNGNNATDPHGASSGSKRVRKGGRSGGSATYCGVSHRGYDSSDYADETRGFRVVRNTGNGVMQTAVSVVTAPKTIDGFVFVEGGTFSMGSNNGNSDEKPVHTATVSSFYMCDHEVTQTEYKELMGGNPSYFKGDNRPVDQVSWKSAIEYCNKLSVSKGLTPCYTNNNGTYTCNWNADGYRLPTEAEWEYAARGGKNGFGYIYSGSNSIDMVAWCGSNSDKQTHDVKTKQSNELGIYDMSGNVWEWCWDVYGNYSSGDTTDPHGLLSGSSRAHRGGGRWDDASGCRVSSRGSNTQDGSDKSLGFRVVCTPATIEQLVQADNSGEISYSTSSIENKEIGSYNLESMSENGETLTFKDLKDMYESYGMTVPEFSLTLTKDGKGKLVAAGEASDITWDSKAKTMTNNGETISYTFKDNKITLSDEDQSMVFVKKN